MTQPAILQDLPPASAFLILRRSADDVSKEIKKLCQRAPAEGWIVGFGIDLLDHLGSPVPGLERFPTDFGGSIKVPSTQADLWVRVGGTDPGKVLHGVRAVRSILEPGFSVEEDVRAFVYDGGRDLTGYRDGTENPDVADAPPVALAPGGGAFVAIQRWQTDYGAFENMDEHEQDLAIGRTRDEDEEIEDAPPSAHIKRTEQESFEPDAHIWRRSMPWTDGQHSGLYFVSFCSALWRFKVQMARMVGADDGITDAIFRFTTPQTGGYYFCPPVKHGVIWL